MEHIRLLAIEGLTSRIRMLEHQCTLHVQIGKFERATVLAEKARSARMELVKLEG